ncbi:MAG: hypothetical protein EOO47_05265 [Flavobacterium sp.]|nr:MAG: hypothetical protein EOO47_05265 [Flavobacterium sp.]
MALLLMASNGFAQQKQLTPWERLAARPSTLGVDQGELSFVAGNLNLKILKSSQTLASLKLKGDEQFDFSPKKFLQHRSSDGLYQLGDINIRLKTANGDWTKYSTATKRANVTALPASGNVLAASDLANTLPADVPLKITRLWEKSGNDLLLRFEIENKSKADVELGSVGVPMIFNNILDGVSLDEAHAQNVFYDPYIGADAGYLQVAKLSGKGAALVVIPQGKTPFEAYSPLLDDPTPRGITFEGFHEWMVLSKAHATTDWKNAEQWNEANSLVLKPGEKKSYAFKFVLSPSIKNVEQTLVANKRPVAVGIPGYVITQDVNAKLFLNYVQGVKSIAVFPKDALIIKPSTTLKNGIKTYDVNGKTWGRARVTVTYNDGLVQTIQYKVIKNETQLVADFGQFLTTKQWFDDANDVFKRAPSVISYDYETKKQVTEDSRAWIAGLGDEGGSGSWLGAMMKQLVLPNAEEITKMERFANETMYGRLQSSKDDSTHYGVKKSLFYYEPTLMPEGTYSKDVNYKTWSAWPKKEADNFGRSYNYPHVAAAHWVLYKLGRYHDGLVKQKDWKWYLESAYHTSIAMVEQAPYYAQFGQMEGSIFVLILDDLKREGLTEMATKMESAMKKRADHWRTLNYPFGSEMPWDSTGQEEVYLWSDYFGYDDKADVTLNAILAYMPTVPHWGYNGSARRYWDFLYGGKLSRVERQLHHYGSGLNAIPVLEAYKKSPADLYLLRVGYGGLLGSVANITEDGFGPSAFHSFPSTLKIDALSGDYGPNFYGYAVNTATYITNDNTYGWLAFGGNLTTNGDLIEVQITTASKGKVFIAPVGLLLSLDAGKFEKVTYNKTTKAVEVTLQAKDKYTPNAYLTIEQPKSNSKQYKPSSALAQEKGAYLIPLQTTTTKVVLK